MLSGKNFQVVAKEKKALALSLSLLSIFRPKNIVISKKRSSLRMIFCISDLQGDHGTMPPKYATGPQIAMNQVENLWI